MSDTTQIPAFIGALDRASEWFGRTLAWLIIIMMLIQFAIVLLRYAFSVNSIFMQELVMYMHASVFMLAAAYTFRHDGHVRVDIFYRGMSPRRQALINIAGIITLLMPVMIFVIASSLGYVANSWRIMETSSDHGGIPAVFVLKTLIPLFALLMIVQGAIEIVRNGYVLAGRIAPPAKDDNHLEERV
ncbi:MULTISPECIES: TRAP transporter small permease subunit [unclassified Halomonas]|uniref:TRAP transporter small permease subunit n=1 Tax=unclassified Halomonas TaxID=2609666 RepID=UPI0006D9871F|nr:MULTISPECIES: TRAP transporter small permease subunit [unclassified Halomonas]KPQ30952.1 MAG: TRAP-type transport system small permease component [Halomonas sp. HL-93]SBR44996.1 TRAP-type mannitol/chloroaromatic compound transport system, small permease component [Halomonas sp. HL-93]SNY97762.1 TRAP-type mannitol/chloroaromatic compound transport system, small permease component [Halomonas sp. hl-4]